MKREEKKIMQYTYGIKDTRGKMIFNISFPVKFFNVDGDLYLENEKSRILVEALNDKDGKKSFERIINMKIREAISAGRLFKLIADWNLDIKPSEIDLDTQMFYSAAMINRFDENNKWSLGV